MIYKVIWDNGHACDSFPERFTSRRRAEQFAVAWKREMVALDPDPREAARVYTWEVIEVGEDPTEDEDEDRCDFEGGTRRAALDGRGRP